MSLPLVTERLLLRWPIESDFTDLSTLWTDPRVAQFMDDYGPRDEPGVRQWLDTHLGGGGQDPSPLQLMLTRRTDSAVVGWLGLGTSQDPLADWNFGYAVHPSHRANGYATEALKAALTYCHTSLSINTIWGECHQANKASAHVMTSAGMQETTPTPTSRRFLYPPTPDPRSGSRTHTESWITVKNSAQPQPKSTNGPTPGGFPLVAWRHPLRR